MSRGHILVRQSNLAEGERVVPQVVQPFVTLLLLARDLFRIIGRVFLRSLSEQGEHKIDNQDPIIKSDEAFVNSSVVAPVEYQHFVPAGDMAREAN